MAVCVFWGHRNCPMKIKEPLRSTVIQLMEEGVTHFMVGNQGAFDLMVRDILEGIEGERSDFKYSVVLDRLPREGEVEIKNSVLPLEVEGCPPRFSIDRRNEYMLKNADIIVCYVWRRVGGAAKFVEKARRQEKRIIYLYEE